MIVKNYWHSTARVSKPQQPLSGDIETNMLIIGGGIAGLHAALELVERGVKDITIIERGVCGSGATGNSSAFLMPDSEMDLNEFIRRFGMEKGLKLWSIPEQGVSLIASTIKKHGISCDLEKQDACFVAEKGDMRTILVEAEARKKAKLPVTVYSKEQLPRFLGGVHGGAVRYGGTYAFHPVNYVNGLKEVLLKKGVTIFEHSEVISKQGMNVFTQTGSIRAKHVFVTVAFADWKLKEASRHAYHTQSYIAVSERLSKEQIKTIFPRDRMMCWDSRLVYSYYRMLADDRLLYGVSSTVTAYAPWMIKPQFLIKWMLKDFNKHFPAADLRWDMYWGGFIPTTIDLVPLVQQQQGTTLVLGCVGLPWAAFCGRYAVRKLLARDKTYDFFLENKHSLVPKVLEPILPKWVRFPLDNLYSAAYQKN